MADDEEYEELSEDVDVEDDGEPETEGKSGGFIAWLKAAKTENLVTILSIGILVFSAITGILAQEFNEVDREASQYESSSTEYISEARTLESIENQQILREEILLTEVKNLVLQKNIFSSEIELLSDSMSANTEDYLQALLAMDLISFQQNGIPVNDGLIEGCDQSNACTKSLVFSSAGDFYVLNYTSYHFESGLDMSVDSYISAFDEILSDYEDVFVDISENGLDDLFFDIGYEIDVSSGNLTLYFVNYEGGINGFVMNQQSLYTELEFDYLDTQFDYDFKIEQESIARFNWMEHNSIATEYLILADVAYYGNDTGIYLNYIDRYLENLSIANGHKSEVEQYALDKAMLAFDIAWIRGDMALNTNLTNIAMSADLSSELDLVSDNLNLVTNNYQSYLDSIESATNGVTNSEELIETLLNDSLAFQGGYIDGETGEFYSDAKQDEFFEAVHAESSERYELSKDAILEAEQVREVATQVSSSVMFVSVGNVTLGIAGGMISRASFGLKNARSIYFLVTGGLVVGMLGLFNSYSILT